MIRNPWRLAFLVALVACRAAGDAPVPPPRHSAPPPPPDRVAVPAGEYPEGCDRASDRECGNDEPEMRPIAVAAFTIDRTEVTVEAYRACIDAGACTAAATVGECNLGEPDRDRFAINCVTWGQARAYCAWAGGRLPTEAEWEAAARGTDGRRFPWGDSPPDDGGIHRADYGEGLVPELWARDRWTYDAPVGTFPAGAGPFGTLDMAGNLAEWVEDAYQGAAVPGARVVRGGSWRDYARRIRTSARDPHPAGQWYVTVGFRCVGLTSP